MAKIFEFKIGGSTSISETYEPKDDTTLAFGENQDGQFDIRSDITGLLSAIDARKDWTNQELADLYRVCHLLNAANILVETDRGVAEDGDPWFVFCRENGDVFIHLCRIDGMYFLDSANLSGPLKGRNFRELITDFTSKIIASPAAESGSGQVLLFSQNQKLRLHPSAMMAALIWTLVLASDELVLVHPKNIGNDSDLSGNEHIRTVNVPVDSNPILKDGKFESDKIASDKVFATLNADSVAFVSNRDASIQTSLLSSSVFTLSLGSIAAALGFLNENSHLNIDSNTRDILQKLEENLLQEVHFHYFDPDIGINQNIEDLALISGPEYSDASYRGDDVSLVRDVVVSDLDLSASEVVSRDFSLISLGRANVNVDRSTNVESSMDVGPRLTLSDLPIETTIKADSLDLDVLTGEEILLSLIDISGAQLSDINLDGVTIKNVRSLSDTESGDLFDWVSSGPSPTQSENLWELDTTAVRLIEFLEAKNGDMYFLSTNNGVLIIDVTAKSGGETATLYWEAEGGQMISFVGLAADFEDFNLVA